MDCRMVVCLLLAVAFVPSLGVDVSKIDIPPGKQADVAVTASEPKTLLSATKVAVGVDVHIQKVPVVTLADAPCKEVCKDKCKVTIEKNCTKVPVEVKECSPAKKTVTTKFCQKKCALTFTTPKVLKGISIDKNTTSLDKGLQMKLPAIPTLKGAVAAVEGAKSAVEDVKEAAAHLAIDGMATIVKNIPIPSCSEVCDDVEFEVPDLECKMVTHMVEECEKEPKKVCEKHCLCIPMKTININLPKKTASASLSLNKEETTA